MMPGSQSAVYTKVGKFKQKKSIYCKFMQKHIIRGLHNFCSKNAVAAKTIGAALNDTTTKSALHPVVSSPI